MSSDICPSQTVIIQSWQSPITELYLLCSAVFILIDRAGNKRVIPDHWAEKRKLGFLEIQLQNWVQPSFIRSYSRVGFEKRKTPAHLHEYLKEETRKGSVLPEPCSHSGHINCAEHEDDEDSAEVNFVKLQDYEHLQNVLNQSLIEDLSEWSNTSLQFTFFYGPRVYQRGSRLSLHVDKMSTHIISAIINIDQHVEKV